MYIDLIADQLQVIINTFKKNINKAGLVFDEDVLSDTILKCNDVIKDKEISTNEAIAYLWKSFKQNSIRELKYARNKTTDEIPEDIIDENDNDLYDEVSNFIIEHYGKDNFILFQMHCDGIKYEDLNTNIDKKHLKYIFRKIRETTRHYFQKN